MPSRPRPRVATCARSRCPRRWVRGSGRPDAHQRYRRGAPLRAPAGGLGSLASARSGARHRRERPTTLTAPSALPKTSGAAGAGKPGSGGASEGLVQACLRRPPERGRSHLLDGLSKGSDEPRAEGGDDRGAGQRYQGRRGDIRGRLPRHLGGPGRGAARKAARSRCDLPDRQELADRTGCRGGGCGAVAQPAAPGAYCTDLRPRRLGARRQGDRRLRARDPAAPVQGWPDGRRATGCRADCAIFRLPFTRSPLRPAGGPRGLAGQRSGAHSRRAGRRFGGRPRPGPREEGVRRDSRRRGSCRCARRANRGRGFGRYPCRASCGGGFGRYPCRASRGGGSADTLPSQSWRRLRQIPLPSQSWRRLRQIPR